MDVITLPLRVGEIYYSIMKLNSVKMKVKTGRQALANFALRAVTADNKTAADNVEKYDIAFVSGQHGDAFVLAEKALKHGASAIVLNSRTCSENTRAMVAELCAQYNVVLIEIEQYRHFASAMELFKNEVENYDKKRFKVNCEMQNILIFGDKPDGCASVVEKYGDLSNISCCVSVLKFVCKGDDSLGRQLLPQIERFVETGLDETAAGSTAICVGTRIALIFAGKAEDTVRSATKAAVEAIPPEFAEKFDIYIGKGRYCRGMENLHESFITASKSAGIQAVRKCANSVLAYEDLGISKLLMQIDPNSGAAKDFLRETISPLVEYDKRNGTNLVDFLAMYFRYNGHIKKIGEEMYMHRNSVNYKVSKIAEIVGRDLSDLNDRSEMFVALKLFELWFGDEIL